MKKDYGYYFYISWYNDKKECIISKARKSDLKYDGDNYVSRGGSEGMEALIFKDLMSALLHAQDYNLGLNDITFRGFNKYDQAFLDALKKLVNNISDPKLFNELLERDISDLIIK